MSNRHLFQNFHNQSSTPNQPPNPFHPPPRLRVIRDSSLSHMPDPSHRKILLALPAETSRVKHFSPSLLYKSGLSHCHLLPGLFQQTKGLCLYSCSFTADSQLSKHSDPLRHNSDHTPSLLKTLEILTYFKAEVATMAPTALLDLARVLGF